MPITLPAVKAESVTLLAVKETSLGVAPTTGWQTIQPNQDAISNYYAQIKTVAPSPISRFRQKEAPQIVDSDSTPSIGHDLTKDMWDVFGEGVLLAKYKHAGGTGLSYFLPTARTTTDYTVAASGALQAGTLVFARGFVNAGNNGLFAVGASSTGTAVKVAGGTAETVSGYVATLEVAGFRGAAGDIQLDGSGDLISTVADFTTMGLVPGMAIWVGGLIGGGHDFATAAYRGFAIVKGPVTANKIPLKRRQWTVGAADNGATKTIDMYWGRWIRNVPFGDADYPSPEPSYHLELTYPGLSGGTTDEYAYSAGNMVSQFELNAPAQNLVSTAIAFLGTTISDPTVTRKTGPSTAGGLLAIDRYNTVTREPYRRLALQSDETIVCDDIESWKMTISNNVSAQKQQGILGTARPIVGKVEAMMDMTGVLTQDNAIKACTGNTTLVAGFGLVNGDGGHFFDLPSLKCTSSPPKFTANGPVGLDLKLEAFRDATLNITVGVSVFPFLPPA